MPPDCYVHVNGWPFALTDYPDNAWRDLVTVSQECGCRALVKGRGTNWWKRVLTVEGQECREVFRLIVAKTLEIFGPDALAECGVPEFIFEDEKVEKDEEPVGKNAVRESRKHENVLDGIRMGRRGSRSGGRGGGQASKVAITAANEDDCVASEDDCVASAATTANVQHRSVLAGADDASSSTLVRGAIPAANTEILKVATASLSVLEDDAAGPDPVLGAGNDANAASQPRVDLAAAEEDASSRTTNIIATARRVDLATPRNATSIAEA